MISLFSKNIFKRNIVLDIQSDLVRGAIIEDGKDDTKKSISTITRAISDTLTPTNNERIIKKILKLAHEVVADLIKESGHHHIASVHYILSSPWVFSEIKTLRMSYDSDKKITENIITELIDHEAQNIPEHFDAYIFEKRIFDVKLNGYSIPSYHGKYAHTLEISFSSTFGAKSFIHNLEHAVARTIQVKKHVFHSALLTQYTILSKMFSGKSEYIYMHIHGELTDIIIVKDTLCRHIASFPCGVKTLSRTLASTFGYSLEYVDSLLSLYENNKLNSEEQQKISPIIESTLKAWGDMCVKSFLVSFDTMHIPKIVFMTAHSHPEIFKNILTSQKKVNLEVVPYNDFIGDHQSALMNMYTHALGDMV